MKIIILNAKSYYGIMALLVTYEISYPTLLVTHMWDREVSILQNSLKYVSGYGKRHLIAQKLKPRYRCLKSQYWKRKPFV